MIFGKIHIYPPALVLVFGWSWILVWTWVSCLIVVKFYNLRIVPESMFLTQTRYRQYRQVGINLLIAIYHIILLTLYICLEENIRNNTAIWLNNTEHSSSFDSEALVYLFLTTLFATPPCVSLLWYTLLFHESCLLLLAVTLIITCCLILDICVLTQLSSYYRFYFKLLYINVIIKSFFVSFFVVLFVCLVCTVF